MVIEAQGGHAVLGSSCTVSEVLRQLWREGSVMVQRRIAERVDIPLDLQLSAAGHDDMTVRGAIASNTSTDPQVLAELAAHEEQRPVQLALVRNLSTPDHALVELVGLDNDMWLHALGRHHEDTPSRRAAARLFAAQSDATGSSAANQIARMLGPCHGVWETSACWAGPDASALVLAAARQSGVGVDVRERVLEWLTRYMHASLGATHRDALDAAAAVGEHLDSTTEQRRRALELLGGSSAGRITEALLVWERIESTPGVAVYLSPLELLDHLEHLQHRVHHERIVPVLVTVLSSVSVRDDAVAARLRRLHTPLIGRAAQQLFDNGRADQLAALMTVVGAGMLDHCTDPWEMIDSVEIPLSVLLDARCFRQQPRRTLSVLRPLSSLCRLERCFLDAAVLAVADVADDAARGTASALLLEWDGTLDELLDTAASLS
jgi:hypothetical protein